MKENMQSLPAQWIYGFPKSPNEHTKFALKKSPNQTRKVRSIIVSAYAEYLIDQLLKKHSHQHFCLKKNHIIVSYV